MKAQGWKIKNSERAARSVLECGSPLPLSTRTGRPSVTQSANGLAHAKTWPVIVGALAFVMIACIASAQSYSIDWYKIAGGGGTSTNLQYIAINNNIGTYWR